MINVDLQHLVDDASCYMQKAIAIVDVTAAYAMPFDEKLSQIIGLNSCHLRGLDHQLCNATNNMPFKDAYKIGKELISFCTQFPSSIEDLKYPEHLE